VVESKNHNWLYLERPVLTWYFTHCFSCHEFVVAICNNLWLWFHWPVPKHENESPFP